MEENHRNLGVLQTQVVGIQHYDGNLKENETVKFKRDPSNPHDRNAIEVHNSIDKMVGHLPREYAEFLAPLMDQDRIILEGTAGLHEERWYIPLNINVSLSRKGEIIFIPVEEHDPASTAHQKVLELFNEWGRVSERRQHEIIAACKEFFSNDIHPETLLLMRLMGVTEDDDIEEDFYEDAPEVSILEVMSELENYQEYLNFFKKEIADSDRGKTTHEMAKLKFIQKYGEDKQQFMLRAILNELIEEILRKKE
ncbi:MAG: hypothetical protein HOF21_07675 [Nitrospina sp.]|jgi:hypothetical protein|nr:hypothetical protein [Nitrospina sp.]